MTDNAFFGNWFGIMYALIALFIFIYPRYELGYKIHLSIKRLTKPKAKVSLSESWRYLIPCESQIGISRLVGMRGWHFLFRPTWIGVIILFLTTSVMSLFIENVHPYLYIYLSYGYWGFIGLVYLSDVIFMWCLASLFGKRGFTRLTAILPPLSAILLSSTVPNYFKANKDQLSGAFNIAK